MLFAFVAVAAISYLYYNKIYKIKSQQVIEKTARIDSLKGEVQSNETILTDLKARVGAMTKAQENAPVDKPTRFLSDLINEINSKESGVTVTKFTTHETPIDNTILAVSLDLELESSFLDLATLVERLEDKYKFLEFKKIETVKVDDFVQKCKSDVSLSIYLNKERI